MYLVKKNLKEFKASFKLAVEKSITCWRNFSSGTILLKHLCRSWYLSGEIEDDNQGRNLATTLVGMLHKSFQTKDACSSTEKFWLSKGKTWCIEKTNKNGYNIVTSISRIWKKNIKKLDRHLWKHYIYTYCKYTKLSVRQKLILYWNTLTIDSLGCMHICAQTCTYVSL